MRVAIYARISDDRDGKAEGVARQVEDCYAKIEDLNRSTTDRLVIVPDKAPDAARDFDTHGAFIDNSISASKYSKVERPAWARLSQLIKSREIDAIVCWNTDRLYRRMSEFVLLTNLVKGGKLELISVTSTTLDLSTSDGIFTASILTAVAEKESNSKSERLVAKKKKQAEKGFWNGGRAPLGYMAVPSTDEDAESIEGDDGDSEVVSAKSKLIEHPINGKAIREAVKELLAGESFVDVLVKFRAETEMPQLEYTSFKYSLIGPSITGRRMHIPQDLRGDLSVHKILTTPDFVENHAQLYPAKWDGLVSIPDWKRLRTRLVKGERGRTPTKSLLAGLVICGNCGSTMGYDGEGISTITGKKRYASYRCAKSTPMKWTKRYSCGTMRVGAMSLEAYISKMYLNWVKLNLHNGTIATRQQSDADAAEIIRLENAQAKQISTLDAFLLMRATGEITPEELARNRMTIDTEVKRLSRELRELTKKTSEDVALRNVVEFWKGLSRSKKHARLSASIRGIVIVKARRFGHTNTMNDERVEHIEWFNPNLDTLRNKTQPALRLVR